MSQQSPSRAGVFAQAPESTSRIRWQAVGPSLLVVWIVANLDKSNISLVIADKGFLHDFGLSGKTFELGLLATGLLVVYGLTAPVWGFVTSRMGARATCIVSLVIWAAACVFSAVSVNYGELLASRLILGFGEASLYPVTLTLVADWFPLRERARATAFWWNGTMIGPMIGGAVVTSLIVAFGWRGQFVFLAALALALPVPMIVFLVRDRPARHPWVSPGERALIEDGALEKEAGHLGRLAREGPSDALRNFRFWLVTIAIGTNAIFFWGWSTWLPTYLKDARHYSFSVSGYLTVVIYGAAIVTIIVTSHVSDRIFRRAPLAVCGWILGGAFLITAGLVPDSTLSVVFIVLSLCGQQVGILSAESVMHSIVAGRNMARSQGMRAFVSQTVTAFAPAGLGAVVAVTHSFLLVFVLLTIAVLISACCMGILIRDGM